MSTAALLHPSPMRPKDYVHELGISYRQFDYWCRTGSISIAGEADGSGSRRRLDNLDRARLAVLARLDEFSWGSSGLPGGLIRAVWDALDRPVEEWPTHIVIEGERYGRRFIVSDLITDDLGVALVVSVAP